MNIGAVISKAPDTANQLHLKYQLEDFMENNDVSKEVIFSDSAYKSGTTIIEESQKLALTVELARNGYAIIIQDDQKVVKQIQAIYGKLFHYQN